MKERLKTTQDERKAGSAHILRTENTKLRAVFCFRSLARKTSALGLPTCQYAQRWSHFSGKWLQWSLPVFQFDFRSPLHLFLRIRSLAHMTITQGLPYGSSPSILFSTEKTSTVTGSVKHLTLASLSSLAVRVFLNLYDRYSNFDAVRTRHLSAESSTSTEAYLPVSLRYLWMSNSSNVPLI